MNTIPAIKRYNVTFSSSVMRKQARMEQPLLELNGSVVLNEVDPPSESFQIAVYDESDAHDAKAEAWRHAICEEMNVTDGVTVRPVLAGYSTPKPLTPDIWFLDYRHLGP